MKKVLVWGLLGIIAGYVIYEFNPKIPLGMGLALCGLCTAILAALDNLPKHSKN